MIMKRTDKDIMELCFDVLPSVAYLTGFNQYAGKLFIPSEQNVDSALKKVNSLRKNVEDELQSKILDSLEAMLLFEEPQPILDDILGTIYSHLVKEGINKEHMLSLLDHAEKALKVGEERFSRKRFPVAVKLLTLYRLEGVVGILDALKSQTRSKELRQRCDSLKQSVGSFGSLFEVKGFDSGQFENVMRIFEREGFSLGREEFYQTALSKGLDYYETPQELEGKAMNWLKEELPLFMDITEKLSEIYKCENNPLVVEKKINTRLDLFKVGLVKTTLKIRRVVQKLVDKEVCNITDRYVTKVVETPKYLTGTIPTGAAQFFDTFTKKPFNIFFQTTDEKRDPDRAFAFLLNLLVHEEYGHCVHHSNSAVRIPSYVREIAMLPVSTSGPISEGLSFNRELEFLEVSKAIEDKEKLKEVEKQYLNLVKSYGGIKLVNMELEFATRRWRIVRFLRVIGDVRINTGKQSLVDFVQWAEQNANVPRSSAYFQLFPAHEGMFPGYATSYAVLGQEILEMERKIRDKENKVKFSTYLCSVGFPPRSIYTKMLQSYLKELQ
jgi:hypothetical protein